MNNNLVGIYEKAFADSFSFEQKAYYTSKLGFDFIELSIDETELRQKRLDFTSEQIAAMKNTLVANNLAIQSLCLSAHRGNPFGSVDQTKRGKAYEIIEKALIFSRELGIRNIQLAGYDVYYEQSTLETEKNFVAGLQYCAQLAERYQIMLSIEIMDTSFIGTLADGKKYIDIIDSPWLKLYVDVGNLYRHSFDIFTELRLFKHEIIQIHIKDTLPNQYRDLNLGEGDVPLAGIKQAVLEQGYNGPFVIEIWNQEGGKECIENIEKNYQYFLNL
ncbi:L-ribulose-5-phosphate 3-epimerase [Mollicutes bacterium LVI A0039]|nr:L-ribulose-5-phosphate 3-epimerase [Mollicutes bacterium LVI A0039]